MDRDSRGKALEDRNIGVQTKYPIAVAPILKVLNKWLDEIGRDNEIKWEILGQELGISGAGACRMHYRYQSGETLYMSFSQADKIVSSLFGPHYWYENEDLAAIYEEHA